MSDPIPAAELFSQLVALGMTHVVGVPDNGTAALFALVAADPAVRLLGVTREGEAFAVAAGLWLGGQRPVVVIQNTGLLESGDALRGTAFRMGVPLPVIVGVRGHAKMVAHRPDIDAERAAGDAAQTMKRPDIDSVALLTAPTLDAWQVPHAEYRGPQDEAGVTELWNLAHDGRHPVAITLPAGLV